MTGLVTLSVAEGIADVRLNRPDKHNSLTLDMFSAINDATTRVARDPAIRVIVLSGNGPSFCAGLDVSLMRELAKGHAHAAAAMDQLFAHDDRQENRAQRTAYAWKTMPVPVIAALQGVAYGGGCQIALGADVRIAGPDVRMSLMEIRYGLVPDMGMTQTLRDLVRMDVAMELVLTGRIVEAEEARSLGLVTRIAPAPLDAAFALARSIAGCSPHAVRAAKRLLNESWRADAGTGLALEETLQSALLGSPNQMEAVNAVLQKRAPSFADPGSAG